MAKRCGRNADEVARWAAASVLPKLCLAAVLILGLLMYLDAGVILDMVRAVDRGALAAATAIIGCQYTFSALRWHIVARRHGISENAGQLHFIFGAGALADLVALTSFAGLTVRGALLVSRGAEMSRVFGVLFIERVSALAGFAFCFVAGVAVVLLAGVAVPFAPDPGIAVLTATVAGVSAIAAIYTLLRLQAVRAFADGLRASFMELPLVAGLVCLSAITIWLGFTAVAILARGLGLQIAPVFFLTIMPVIALLAALPVSIGGWGVREGAMAAGLSLFGVRPEEAVALSILYGMLGTTVTVLLASPGAVLLYGKKK